MGPRTPDLALQRRLTLARRKRKKAAPAGRVLATGLSATAMLGIVTVMASQPPPSWELETTAAPTADGSGETSPTTVVTTITPATTVPVTTIVTRVEQRVIKVYDDGAPVGNGSATPAAPRGGAAPGPSPEPAPVAGTPTPQPTPRPNPTPTLVPPPTVAPTPPPAPPTTAAPVPKCKASKC